MASNLSPVFRALAFEVARTLTKIPFRLECCCRIAKYAPAGALDGEMRVVLNLALEKLHDPRERAEALIKLLNVGPPVLTGPLVEDAFQTISQVLHPTHRAELLIEVGSWGSREAAQMEADLIGESFGPIREVVGRDVLKTLAPVLPPELARRALDTLKNCGDDDLRCEAMPQLLARIAALGDTNGSFEFALARSSKNQQEECLMVLSPYLDKPVLLRSARAYLAIDNVYRRDRALSAFCVRATREGLAQRLGGCAFEIRDPCERASAFCALVIAVPEEQKTALLKEAMRSFANTNVRMRGNIIDALAEGLSTLKSQDMREHILKLLTIMTSESREELTPKLYALAPVFRSLGGPKAADHVLSAVRQVSRWWG